MEYADTLVSKHLADFGFILYCNGCKESCKNVFFQ